MGPPYARPFTDITEKYFFDCQCPTVMVESAIKVTDVTMLISTTSTSIGRSSLQNFDSVARGAGVAAGSRLLGLALCAAKEKSLKAQQKFRYVGSGFWRRRSFALADRELLASSLQARDRHGICWRCPLGPAGG